MITHEKPHASQPSAQHLKLRRAIISVSEKEGLEALASCFHDLGIEMIASGKTADVIRQVGFSVTPVEKISGNPEVFSGRVKTLSYQIAGGILYRRGVSKDEEDLEKLKILPIDCVVVNFYPFEKMVSQSGISQTELVEYVDIGGPTLVRSGAKNSPHVLVLTSPAQYGEVIRELRHTGTISLDQVKRCGAESWDLIAAYDNAIAKQLGKRAQEINRKLGLRYGENPHQSATLEIHGSSPIAWDTKIGEMELSYNNIVDISSAYPVMSDLKKLFPLSTSVMIVKHNNPCGVALVPFQKDGDLEYAQKVALQKAWEGDPISAFGGVLLFSHPLFSTSAHWLSNHFIEVIAAPGIGDTSDSLAILLNKRKNLRVVEIRRFGESPAQMSYNVPGGMLIQESDSNLMEPLQSVTHIPWPENKGGLAQFGIVVCRGLKSNAVAIVQETQYQGAGMTGPNTSTGLSARYSLSGIFQLIGAGQGQPNRIDALKSLAVPRAQETLKKEHKGLEDCVLISDAFFPFRDTVEAAYLAGIRWIVQPGGSVRDQESIQACNAHQMGMVFTGIRHFKH